MTGEGMAGRDRKQRESRPGQAGRRLQADGRGTVQEQNGDRGGR